MKQVIIDSAHNLGRGITGVAAIDGVNGISQGSEVFDLVLKLLVTLVTAAPVLKGIYSSVKGLFKKSS